MKTITVIGAWNTDILCHAESPFQSGDSVIGDIRTYPGGVGRNVFVNLARLNDHVRFLTLAPKNQRGIDHLSSYDVRVRRKKGPAPRYVAIHDHHGELMAAINDMMLFEQATADDFGDVTELIETSDAIVLDANLSEDCLWDFATAAQGRTLFAEAVSTEKLARFISILQELDYLKINHKEADALKTACGMDTLESIAEAYQIGLVVTSGDQPVRLYRHGNIHQHDVYPIKGPKHANGAGDAFFAGFIHGILNGFSPRKSLAFGSFLARITLKVRQADHPDVGPETITAFEEVYHDV